MTPGEIEWWHRQVETFVGVLADDPVIPEEQQLKYQIIDLLGKVQAKLQQLHGNWPKKPTG